VKGFLNDHWTHEDLHRTFEKYGSILSAKISIDREHKSKGYGYVRFETPEQAQTAINEVKFTYRTLQY
jgi:polyadenylate-binding protein